MLRSTSRFEFPGGRLRAATGLCALFAVTVALALPIAAYGQPPIDPGTKWKAQGPGPAVDGQIENVPPNNPITGAIHTVLAHPTNANILYIGSVNGGVWKTTNAQSLTPSWTALTDTLATSAIGAMAFDTTDATSNTIWAGVGRYSSFGRLGGNRVGLYKTTNGGSSWTSVTGGGVLLGKNISGVVAQGNTIVISVNQADVNAIPNLGIWRSTDGGATFTQISNGNGTLTGLPGGVTYDLVVDSTNPARLFTSVTFATLVGGTNGVYRSLDTGATWAKVSNAAMDAVLTNAASNTEFAVGLNNNVYCAIVNPGRLAGLFRSGDGGTTWTEMDRPRTGPNNVGIHPGAQGSIHMSILADRTNHNLVYLGGDRQPFTLEEGLPFPPQFPNSIGANNFSGRLFRCDASLASGSQCTPLTHTGTASNSSPHADSREMTFDAAGHIVETDDGGVYRRTSPATNAGDWFSVIGDLQVTEVHDNSYDTLADIAFVGTQDNDDPHQDKKNKPEWFVLLSGDGGDTAVDNQTLAPGQSIRYDSAQGLQAFVRTFWNHANDLLGFVFPNLAPLDGAPRCSGQFVTPVEINAIQPTRLIFGCANGTYETFDQGDTIRRISTVVINGSGVEPVSYGGVGNPDLLVVGSGDRVFIRTAAHPAPLTQNATYPGTGTGRTVRDTVIDPDNANAFYLTNLTQVFQTLDGGLTWTDVSGNIQSFAPIALRGIAYVPRTTNDALVVSTFNGIYVAYQSTNFTVWAPLGTGMPNVPIFDLAYDAVHHVLVAGTLGRGAWSLNVGAD
ncbi:MAG TPA: RTX toxin [Thermoanaerobaculia bacterium]|nr:RTX toxin [Thermoanaerobaculia bacterium]